MNDVSENDQLVACYLHGLRLSMQSDWSVHSVPTVDEADQRPKVTENYQRKYKQAAGPSYNRPDKGLIQDISRSTSKGQEGRINCD